MLCLKPVCAKVCEYCQFSIYYSDEETRNLGKGSTASS
jgi:coproporphyrinogen III oxidase-like Fe-S oxidoreductase